MTSILDLARAQRDHLATLCDQAEAEGRTAEADRLWDLLSDAWDIVHAAEREAEHAASEAPRRAAEARLAYHVEHDTLDLY